MKQNLNSPSIGIDLTGSDRNPREILDSVLPILDKLQSVACFHLFSFDLIPPSFVSYTNCTSVISMDDDPLVSIRKKKDSAIYLGIHALKRKEIDAFISMGNTGALLLSAKMQLPSIDRPALLVELPTRSNPVAVLDVGATTSCLSDHLVEFALMGISYQQTKGISCPKVGILNIGKEPLKGRAEHLEAYQKLHSLIPTHFIGNIEARDVFEGATDVLVTDGFTGNIFLKTAEGLTSSLLKTTKLTNPDLDYANYPGAVLCGVDGIVLKCHGVGHTSSLHQTIELSLKLIQSDFLKKMKFRFSS